ncbi:MAG: ABC transporter substrate-binding protein [Proteobacteria bacterium]|nr:ABC transporter substrate-binding protein [Pseudomonadota bacterium]
MGKTTRRFAVSIFMGFIVFSLLAMVVGLPVVAGDADRTGNGWIWTEENPKPSWWRWDETYYPEKPVRGGYFQVRSTRYIGLMNPSHYPVNDWSAMSDMYDRLILMDGQTKACIPWLASSWKHENPLTVLMTLRKGVVFHDGSPFNAHSVKYQMDWIMDRKSGAWTRMWIRPLKSVEIVDEYTVRWHFKHSWSAFADIMSTTPAFMMSTKALKADVALQNAKRLARKVKLAKKKLEKAERKAEKAAGQGGSKAGKAAAKVEKARQKLAGLENQLKKARAASAGAVSLDSKAVGAGRVMVEEARPGNYLKLKRHPNWWFGGSIGKPDMPYYDGRKITVIPEPSVALANLKAGRLDTLGIESSQYRQVKDDPKLDVYVSKTNFTLLLAFNHKKGPFTDIRVRKAISHAIDRKAVVAASSGGFGDVASCYFPPDHYAHNPNLKPIPYNPELAKKLLAQAGYSNGMTVRGIMWSDPGSVRLGQIIKAMLKRVNVDWKLSMLDPVAATDQFRNLEFELNVLIAPYIQSPDSSMTLFYDPDADDKRKRIENPRVMAIIKAARQELDFEKRKQMYWDIEKALYDNYDDAWMYHPAYISATRKRVRGYNREMSFAGGDAYWPTHPGWFKDGKRH